MGRPKCGTSLEIYLGVRFIEPKISTLFLILFGASGFRAVAKCVCLATPKLGLVTHPGAGPAGNFRPPP